MAVRSRNSAVKTKWPAYAAFVGISDHVGSVEEIEGLVAT